MTALLMDRKALNERKILIAEINKLRPDAPKLLSDHRDHAWAILVQAELRAPEVVEQLIAQPNIGFWLAHTLRYAHGRVRDDTPLWVHVGYLHAIAAAAAIRAGVEDFSLPVATNQGTVGLPTLGRAWVSDESDVAEVVQRQGRIQIKGRDKKVEIPRDNTEIPGWEPYRILKVRDDTRVEVGLDDIDPYRNFQVPSKPSREDRLDPAIAAQWQSMFEKAWALLIKDHPQQATELTRGLHVIVPLPASQRFKQLSASSNKHIGSATMSLPDDPVQLAVALVHEYDHTKLNRILNSSKLLEHTPEGIRVYAPWRDDPRPLSGLLHGVYASSGIAEFWSTRRRVDSGPAGDLATFEFGLWREKVQTALKTFNKNPVVTKAGRQLIRQLAKTTENWLAESVPNEMLKLAQVANLDHYAMWLTYHSLPSQEAIDTMFKAWASKSTLNPVNLANIPMELSTNLQARQLDTRALLVRLKLSDPDSFEALLKTPETVTDMAPYGSKADVAYVAGDLKTAEQLYLQQLQDNSNEPRSLVGLGLTKKAINPDNSVVDALLSWPHTILALHKRLNDAPGSSVVPSHTELAEWLVAT